MMKKKAQISLQFLLTFFIFIVMLIFVVFAFLFHYLTFYQGLKDKIKYQHLLQYQVRFQELSSNNGVMNVTFYNLIKECSKNPYLDPRTAKINPSYQEIINMLGLDNIEDIRIEVKDYIILLANITQDVNNTIGFYSLPTKTIKFKINKTNSNLFNTLVLYDGGETPLHIGDSYTFNGKNYILKVIDRSEGRYAIFESSTEIVCGPWRNENSVSTTLYASYNNTINKFTITLW